MEIIKNWIKSITGYAFSNVLPTILLFVAGILIIRIIMKIVKTALGKSFAEKAVVRLVTSVIRIVLYLLLCLILASRLGIDVTGVVALASVLTLAISLSVQNALTNLIGGFTLLCTKPFVTGDFVEIAGQSGTVQEVGLTYSKLATADNKIVSIPNSAVTAAEIINYSTTGTRRVDIKVSVSYTAPTETVLEAMLSAAEGLPLLEDKEPFVGISGYSEQSVLYVLQLWCKAEDYWPNTFAANKKVKENLDAKGIPMTCLNVNLHVEK